MRYTLAAKMAGAKANKLVPQELRHSGILSLQWLNENRYGSVFHLAFMPAPTCAMMVDAIARRIIKKHGGPVSGQEVARIRGKWAPTIHSHSAQLTRYLRDYVWPYQTPRLIREQNLFSQELLTIWPEGLRLINIPIKIAPRRHCRWCGVEVNYKDHWLGEPVHSGEGHYFWDRKSKTVRCNDRACRELDYYRHIPQSKGGVDLTPQQRKAVSFDAWDGQRAINYMAKVTKELKRASRANHVVR